ncbi:MAG: S9 family peptidase [Candidatus Eisenbacteria bacterium]|nr:S9 family peptidase [Candidatus Eisenbacteria bacterium]
MRSLPVHIRLLSAACSMFAAAALGVLLIATTPYLSAAQPPTRISVATDTIHGHVIEDPYRWLEDFESEEAQSWIGAQLAYMDSILGAYPDRDAIRARLDELFKIPNLGGSWMREGRIFFVRRDPENEQSILYCQDGLDGEPKVLVDPETMGGEKRVSMDWWYPSVDTKLLAYGLSEEGNESSVLHLMNVDTGEHLPLEIPNMRAASLAWRRDTRGFYYTRFPSPGEVPDNELFFHRKIYYHELETDPADDPVVFADEENIYAWPGVSLSTNGRFLLVYVFAGYTSNDLYVKDLQMDGGFVPIAAGLDARFSGYAYDDQLYLMTTLDAPNWRILRVDLKDPTMENWTEIIPESTDAMQHYMIAGDYLVVDYLKDAKSVIKLFTLDGEYVRDVPLPELCSVFDMSSDYRYPEILVGLSSYLLPPVSYHYDIPSGELTPFMDVDAPIDSDPYVARQVWYESKDGTRIPMFLVHRKDIVLDGSNPTLLTGYGGFASSITPSFTRNRFLWMEHGGVYAEPCLRGGGEYGDAWHRAGMLANKQNVFDDFIAAAEWLIDNSYTSPENLAVWGGSNGGLLIGAFVTQRPDLARAAICDVPLLDMVRFPRFYGASIWTTEYGHPDDPEQFEWLYAYSPYHHVEAGVTYPAMLITTAESDTRVHPSHAMKMTARLQAESGSEAPIFLRYESAAGHGTGTTMSMLLDQYTDYYSFLFGQLGMRF